MTSSTTIWTGSAVTVACDRLWAVQDAVVDVLHWDEVGAQHGKAQRRVLHQLGRARYGPLS